MKLTNITLLVLLLHTLSVIANNCENYPEYKCCSNEDIELTHWNETGIWGKENGVDCLSTYGFCSEKQSNSSKPPLSKFKFKDEAGLWGVENDTWCLYKYNYCSIFGKFNFEDKYVAWGIDNEDWCMFDYCKEDNLEYQYVDDSSVWGVFKKRWCKIKNSKGTCGSIGYPCCKKNYKKSTETIETKYFHFNKENDNICIIEDESKYGAINTIYPRCQNTTEIVGKTLNRNLELGIEEKNNKQITCVFDYTVGYNGLPYDKCEYAYYTIGRFDDNLRWGEENGRYCLMDDAYYNLAIEDCFSIKYEHRCCLSNDTPVMYTRPTGEKFGLENNRVCGIRSSSNSSSNTITKSKTTTTTTKRKTTTTTKRKTTTKAKPYVTSTSPETKCAGLYGQCGGIGFSNVQLCCKEGLYCKKINDYYHQCSPIED
ncbi:hypothetical protein BCR32DRAFT_281471 [Anaeromyces robustus]|uniref:CBM1 domain-containing protein n=1 Tax=Anaeromyces robustus TaxID=1754192 RepID=A0A1Y1X0Y9_9FUNG|nr:hypothetical protein BCR32DRAFT_281471 [Anaeromyces robustus]|eukprot:ORX79362.1 hypothetical protein BCR32DRAFT_281471 [Anaeromyces robustus]